MKMTNLSILKIKERRKNRNLNNQLENLKYLNNKCLVNSKQMRKKDLMKKILQTQKIVKAQMKKKKMQP